MARREIDAFWDRKTRNNLNENFKELYDKDDNIQQQVNDLVLESGGDSNLEVVQARGGHRVLNDRLNSIDSQLAQTVNKVDGLIVNVTDFGADGSKEQGDVTEKIQNAIDYAINVNASELYIPDGHYMVDAEIGLHVQSNLNINISHGAIMEVIATANNNYALFTVDGKENVKIYGGGTLKGDRQLHLGTTGEWGHCLVVRNSNNIVIENLKIEDAWGDGLTISSGNPNNITVRNCVFDNNRRQGITILSGTNIWVTDNIIKNTNGTEPEAGIDIEPNEGDHCKNIYIKNNIIENNTRRGIEMSVRTSLADASVSNVYIEGNRIVGSTNGIRADRVSDITITNNAIDDVEIGISSTVVQELIVANNKITNSSNRGVRVSFSSLIVDSNVFEGNASVILEINSCEPLKITSNKFTSYNSSFIYIGTCPNADISNNSFLNVNKRVMDINNSPHIAFNNNTFIGVENISANSLIMLRNSGSASISNMNIYNYPTSILTFNNTKESIISNLVIKNSLYNNTPIFILANGSSNNIFSDIVCKSDKTEKADLIATHESSNYNLYSNINAFGGVEGLLEGGVHNNIINYRGLDGIWVLPSQ